MYFKQNGKNVKCNLNEGRGALGIATYLTSNPRYPRVFGKILFCKFVQCVETVLAVWIHIYVYIENI